MAAPKKPAARRAAAPKSVPPALASDRERRSQIAAKRRQALERSTDRAAERAAHRAQLVDAQRLIQQRAYDAAAWDPTIPHSAYSSLSPNQEIMAALVRSRQLVRDVMRNHPDAQQAKRAFVNGILGDGIFARAAVRLSDDPSDRELDRAMSTNRMVNDVVDAHLEDRGIDVRGQMDFYTMVEMGLGTAAVDGDFLIIKRWRTESQTVSAGLKLPYQLQSLEGDWLDTKINSYPARGRNNDVIGGVEVDRYDRVQAFHVLDNDPALDGGMGTSTRVPAEDVIFFMKPERFGQRRGISIFVGVIHTLYDLSDVKDAFLKRAKLEAALMIVMGVEDGTPRYGTSIGDMGTLGDDDQPPPADDAGEAHVYDVDDDGYIPPRGEMVDGGGSPMETMRSGTIARVRKGTDVKQMQVTPSGGLKDFVEVSQRSLANAPGVTYESVTGDYKGLNYATGRLSSAAAEAAALSWRWLIRTLIILPVWRDCCTAANFMDAWGYPGYWSADQYDPDHNRVVMPKRISADPQKDAKAVETRLATKEQTLTNVCEQNGTDIVSHLRELAMERRIAQKMGIDLDAAAATATKTGNQIQDGTDEAEVAGQEDE